MSSPVAPCLPSACSDVGDTPAAMPLVVDGRGTFGLWQAPCDALAEVAARSVSAAFDRQRLRLARDARGMSQREVADAAGLTSAAVSQFESGAARPSPASLESLAEALSMPLAFFAAGGLVVEETAPAYFRSLRSASPRVRRTIRARAELVHLFVQALELHIALPGNRVPRYRVDAAAESDHVESIAGATRRDWNLPSGPIADVVRTVERAGVVTVRMPSETDKVDAFSVPFSSRPVVVLGNEKGKRDRSRFDAAHELAHLILHDDEMCGTKVAEDQANWFAAAFLMPSGDIADDLGGGVDWDRLIHLKSVWHVSLGALLRRKHHLGMLSKAGYIGALKQMSARGWTREEPGALGPPEMPVLIPKAVSMLADTGISLAAIADAAALPLADVEQIVGATGPGRLEVLV